MRYQAVPASSETILRYASFLGQFLKYNSVRQYLNIIRVMHREFDLKKSVVGQPQSLNVIAGNEKATWWYCSVETSHDPSLTQGHVT